MDFSMDVCDTELIKEEVINEVKPAQKDVDKLKVITDKNVKVSEGKSLTGNDSFQVYVAKNQTV